MIVLSQAPEDFTERSNDDTTPSTLAARAAGFEVFHLPQRLAPDEALAEAFARIPVQPTVRPAIWVGLIPSFASYQAVYAQALERRIRLVNTPEEHRIVFEFDLAYPFLQGLTPRSVVVTTAEEVEPAVAALGLPVFIKGALSSRKSLGWKACVADTLDEARELVATLLKNQHRSRGRVIVRELAPLRHHRVSATDFPVGREFRVFLYRGEVVGSGYYWTFYHEQAALQPEEEKVMLKLAEEAARRLPVPYVSMDIGQLEDGRWIVIEPGDPQFSGVSYIPLPALWRRLRALLEADGAAGAPLT